MSKTEFTVTINKPKSNLHSKPIRTSETGSFINFLRDNTSTSFYELNELRNIRLTVENELYEPPKQVNSRQNSRDETRIDRKKVIEKSYRTPYQHNSRRIGQRGNLSRYRSEPYRDQRRPRSPQRISMRNRNYWQHQHNDAQRNYPMRDWSPPRYRGETRIGYIGSRIQQREKIMRRRDHQSLTNRRQRSRSRFDATRNRREFPKEFRERRKIPNTRTRFSPNNQNDPVNFSKDVVREEGEIDSENEENNDEGSYEYSYEENIEEQDDLPSVANKYVDKKPGCDAGSEDEEWFLEPNDVDGLF